MSKIGCEVIRDLMILDIDELTSNESKNLIKEHIENCDDCNEYYSLLKEKDYINIKVKEEEVSENTDKELVKKIKKDIINRDIILIIIIAIVATLLSSGDLTFQGIGIMPIVGAVIYLKTDSKFFAPIIVLIIKSIYQIVEILTFEPQLNFDIIVTTIYSAIIFSLVYSMLALIGVLIGWLIKKIFFEGE